MSSIRSINPTRLRGPLLWCALFCALTGCGGGSSGSVDTAPSTAGTNASDSGTPATTRDGSSTDGSSAPAPASPSPNGVSPGGSASASSQGHWTVTSLITVLGPNTVPVSINNAGDILANQDENPPKNVGQMGGPHVFQPVLYRDGAVTKLGHLNGQLTLGRRINNKGQVIGTDFNESDMKTRGFLWADGQMHDVANLGGGIMAAEGINDNGHIAGTVSASDNAAYKGSMAVTLINGTRSPIPLLPDDFENQASSINIKDEVLGVATNKTRNHAIFYSGGSVRDLSSLPGCDWPQMVSLNDQSQLAGTCGGPAAANTAEQKAFILKEGLMTMLPPSFGVGIQPHALNNQGMVVGHILVPDDPSRGATQDKAHPFFYDGKQLIDLATLDDVKASGWVLYSALLMNDSGQIVVEGTLNGMHGYALLSPPASIVPQ